MPSVQDIKRALARINAAIPAQKKVAGDYRNIRLGLERIARIVPDEQPWVGVHVAGTNGKGSICALLAGMFKQSGLSHGTFTSPAIPEKHNGVTINGLYVNKRMYEMELKHIQTAFKRVASGWRFTTGEDAGDLTPFELETAAAFRVFTKMHVKYGIVEVGMGGGTDATNVMKQKGVTVISKIGLDHQEYLGNTIQDIAKVKAGIMRPGVPCIVDYTNEEPVLDVLMKHAQEVGTQITLSRKAEPLLESIDGERFQLEDYEKQNLMCASLAFRTLFPNLTIDMNRLLESKPYLPGRKELVSVTGLTHGMREESVFVDGAHNMLGVENLAKFVDDKVRENQDPVTWIMGLSSSKTKPFAQLLEKLLRPQDNFAFVEYIRGPNDPEAVPAELGRDLGRSILQNDEQVFEGAPSITSAMQWASHKSKGGPIIVTGSLYLIRQFYSLEGVERARKTKTRRPGRAQLWYYTKLAQERELTIEEEKEFKQARRHWYLSPDRNPTFGNVAEGGKPESPVISEEIMALQRQATYHKKQAQGYTSGIESLRNDLDQKDSPATAAKVEELIQRRNEHNTLYNQTLSKIRGRPVDPDKKYLTYEQIFGYPKKSRSTRPPKVQGNKQASQQSTQQASDAAPDQSSTKNPESYPKDTNTTNTQEHIKRDDEIAQEAKDMVEKLTQGRR